MNPGEILTNLAGWTLRNSLSAGLMIALVLLVQVTVGRRLRPAWRHALWLLVLVRLALPVAPSSPLSLSNLLPSALRGPQRAPPAAPTARAPALVPGLPAAPVPAERFADGPPAEIAATPAEVASLPTSVLTVPSPDRTAAHAERPSQEAMAGPQQVPGSNSPGTPEGEQLGPPRQLPAGANVSSPLDSQRFANAATSATATVLPASAGTRPWWWLLPYIWAAGAALLLGRMAVASVLFSTRLAGAAPPDDPRLLALLERCRAQVGLRRRVRLIETSIVAAPAVAGVLRPRVLLPAGLAGTLDESALELVLLHELGHVKRLDVLVNWLAGFLAALHWFNPLVHLAVARLKIERELACDAGVLSLRRNAGREYGNVILTLLERLRRGGSPTLGLIGVLEGKQAIQRRIAMISEFGRTKNWGFFPAVALLASLAVLSCDATSQTGRPSGVPTAAPAAPQAAGAPTAGATAAATEAPSSENPADAAIRKALTQQEKVDFSSKVTLGAALDWFGGASGVPMQVMWNALQAAGIEKQTPVTVKLGKIRLDRGLVAVLAEAGGVNPLGYAVRDGVLIVSTRDDLSRSTFTWLYDVRDLLPSAKYEGGVPVEGLIGMVMEAVARESWIINSGTSGVISANDGVLMITQTYENHEAAAKLLADMRGLLVPKWRREMAEKLNKPVPKLEFSGIEFDAVADFLPEWTGLNIAVDNSILGRMPPVTLKVENVTAEQALSLLAKVAGLEWRMTDGAILIRQSGPATPLGAFPGPVMPGYAAPGVGGVPVSRSNAPGIVSGALGPAPSGPARAAGGGPTPGPAPSTRP